MSGFDPYFDWSKITDEQAQEFASKLRMLDQLKGMVNADLTPEQTRKIVSSMFEVHEKLDAASVAIRETAHTVPLMIHKVGPKMTTTPSEIGFEIPLQEITVQRCSRCASVVSVWYEGMAVMTGPGQFQPLEEENVAWWPEGSLVGKTSDTSGVATVVRVHEPLEPHHMMCVGIPNL